MSGAMLRPRSLAGSTRYAGGTASIFALLAPRPSHVSGSAHRSIDEQLLRLARTWGHAPRVERAVARFSSIGEHGAVWLVLGAAGSVIASPERRTAWWRSTLVVASTYAANTALKLIVGRRRPELDGLPPLAKTPTQLSFPSAHTSTSFAAALAYSRLGVPRVPLYGLAGSLALSRLYLGLHYPSDVLAGALFGSAIAAACAPVEA